MQRLWAPWRLQYVTELQPKQEGCFFCNAFEDVGNEEEHLLLHRGERALIMLNRFPYNGGHIMVAPARHFGDFEEAEPEEILEIWRLVALSKAVVKRMLQAQGVNIGVNQGKCAGAGVLDHLHVHLVPRWEGDVNFMPVMTDIKIMPQALVECHKLLYPVFAEMAEEFENQGE